VRPGRDAAPLPSS